MYNNQYQMDSYPQDQQKQEHYQSQQQYHQPQQGFTSQPRNYPKMDAPPSYAPAGPSIVHNHTTVVTQQPAPVSKIKFCLIAIKESSCQGFEMFLCSQTFARNSSWHSWKVRKLQ